MQTFGIANLSPSTVVISLNKKLYSHFSSGNENLASVGCKFSLTESGVDCCWPPVEHLSKPVSPQRTFTVHSAL